MWGCTVPLDECVWVFVFCLVVGEGSRLACIQWLFMLTLQDPIARLGLYLMLVLMLGPAGRMHRSFPSWHDVDELLPTTR